MKSRDVPREVDRRDGEFREVRFGNAEDVLQTAWVTQVEESTVEWDIQQFVAISCDRVSQLNVLGNVFEVFEFRSVGKDIYKNSECCDQT